MAKCKSHKSQPSNNGLSSQKRISIPRNLGGDIKNRLSSDTFRCFVNASDNEEEPVELLIYEQVGEDFFGDGVSATGVVEFLNGNKGRDIKVRINSPGGLVFDGITIYNALVAHDKNVEVTIEGLAASAATIISSAGDTVKMNANASFMIHRALALAVGNEAVMTDTAKLLQKLDKQIAGTLAARSKLSTEEVLNLMIGEVDGEFFDAAEALEHGFIDEIIPLKGSEASESDSDDEDVPNDEKAAWAALAASLNHDVEARLRVLDLDKDILHIS